MVAPVVAALLAFSLNAYAADEPAATEAHPDHAHACKVHCTDPHACCEESKKVLDILEKLVTAYSAGDIQAYEKYLDDKCIVFDEGTHKVISGKANVLKTLRDHFSEHAPGGSKPLKSFQIDQPFAKVSDTGDTCVVTFVATKDVGGSNPHKERANVTDIFVKRGTEWKKLHWQGSWQPVVDN